MTENKNSFEYTYSAKEQAEIKKIRDKYTATEQKEPSTIEKLRALDEGVNKKASVSALSIGIIGTLVLGTGMSLFMSEFGAFLGIGENTSLIIGLLLGIIGLVLIAFAYPLYKSIIKRERKRIAPEILRLTEELMK